MKTVFAVLALFVSFSTAQTVQLYYSTDLTITPAQIKVSPGYQTHIDLYGSNELVVLPKDIVEINDLNTQVVLIAKETRGMTGLTLEVDGRPLLFEVIIESDDPRPRRYIIKRDRGGSYARAESIFQPIAPDPSQTPQSQTGVNPPDDIRFSVSNNAVDSQGNLVAFFSFTNTTTNRIALDPMRLVLTQNGQRLERKVQKTPLRNFVAAGETQTGIINLTGVSPNLPVLLSWEYISITNEGGQSYVLSEMFNR